MAGTYYQMYIQIIVIINKMKFLNHTLLMCIVLILFNVNAYSAEMKKETVVKEEKIALQKKAEMMKWDRTELIVLTRGKKLKQNW